MLIKLNFNFFKYEYYNNNLKEHRLGGPSIKTSHGNIWWYKKGMLHREDGAAVEYIDGGKYYHLNGNEYSETKYWSLIRFGGFV